MGCHGFQKGSRNLQKMDLKQWTRHLIIFSAYSTLLQSWGLNPSILTQVLMVGECPVSSFRSCPDKLLDHLPAQNRLVLCGLSPLRPGTKWCVRGLKQHKAMSALVVKNKRVGRGRIRRFRHAAMGRSLIKFNITARDEIDTYMHSFWQTLQKK